MKRVETRELSTIMYDGTCAGMSVMNGATVKINKEEYERLKKTIVAYQSFLIANNKSFKFKSKNSAPIKGEVVDATCVDLSVNERGECFYLNINGNLISFLTGQNIVGLHDLGGMIEESFEVLVRVLRSRLRDPRFNFSADVWDQVEKRTIHLSRLVLTMYSSNQMDNKSIQDLIVFMKDVFSTT